MNARRGAALAITAALALTLTSCDWYFVVGPTATPTASDGSSGPPTGTPEPSETPIEDATGDPTEESTTTPIDSPEPTDSPTLTPTATRTPTPTPTRTPTPTPTPTVTPAPTPTPTTTATAAVYPWHTRIVATTFWVGEIFDATAEDGSQVISTYDSNWLGSYGGCDGDASSGTCQTEARTAANDYFPTSMTPKENPFYLDLPFDDVNDRLAFARRGSVIPWATDALFAGRLADPSISLMKNQWVELVKDGKHCFGQIEDAGPGEYNDADYVFGSTDARPANLRYGAAGADVSPALNGCLGFAELDGDADLIDWRFVDKADVPEGPWLKVVTDSGVR